VVSSAAHGVAEEGGGGVQPVAEPGRGGAGSVAQTGVRVCVGGGGPVRWA
jgi:hypothetical protein